MDAPEIRLRESPRIEVTGRVRLQLASSALLIDAAMLDLSATGMGLATSVATPKPAAGESCGFDFALDGLRVEGRGVVVWSRRARADRGDAANVGVHFQRLEGAGEREVAAVVERGLASVRRPSIAARRVFIAPEPHRSAEALVPASATIPSMAAVALEPSPPAAPAPARVFAPAAVAAPEVAPRAPSPAPVSPLGEPAPEASQARLPWAEPDGPAAALAKRRLVWLGVVGATVTLAAGLGLWSLFEPNDAAPARSDSAAVDRVSVEPIAAVAPEPITDTAAVAEGERHAESSDAAAAVPALGAAVAAPDRAAPGDSTAASRARGIVAIEPSAADGGEAVILRADAPWRRQDIFAALIGPDPPRYLLRLSGIERPWRPANLEVGSPLVQRVRTGLHSTPRGPELHVVLDLSTRAVEHSFEIEGEALRVRLRPRTP
jgi:hypothetical protein